MKQIHEPDPRIMKALNALSCDKSIARFAWAPDFNEKDRELFERRADWLRLVGADVSFRFRLWDQLPAVVRARLSGNFEDKSNAAH